MKAQVSAMARHRYETAQVPTTSAVGYTGDYGNGNESVLEKAIASRRVASEPTSAAAVQNRPIETPRYVGQGAGVGLAKPVAAATHEIEEPKSSAGALIASAVAIGAMLL